MSIYINDAPNTQVTFNNNNDLLFLGANIFGHDFFHDFNIVSFKPRLNKIRTEIRGLEEFLPTLEENIIKAENIIGGTIIDEDVQYNEDTNDYLYMGDFNDTFLRINGVITRSQTKKIQIMLDFINETKLYVLGYFYSDIPSYGGDISIYPQKRDMVFINKKKQSIAKDVNIGEPNRKSTVIGEQLQSTENRIFQNYEEFDFFKKSVRYGFNALFNELNSEDSTYTELKNYYIMMFKIYLLCESDNIHPLDVFNNIIIESTLFNIMKDPDCFNFLRFNNENELDNYILNILNSVIGSNTHTKDNNKIIGGATAQDISDLQDTIIPIYNYFSVPLSTDFINSIEPFYDQANQIIDLIVEMKTQRSDDITTKLLTQMSKKIQPLKLVLDRAITKYRSFSERGRDTRKTILIKNVFEAFSNIFSLIYDHVNSYNTKITRTNNLISKLEESGYMTNSEFAPVQKICKSVAYGVLKYILGAIEPTNENPRWEIPIFENHSLLNEQAKIIEQVYNGSKLSAIDDNLLKSLKSYLTNNNNPNARNVKIYNYDIKKKNMKQNIRDAVKNHWTNNAPRSIVDNATTLEVLNIINQTDPTGRETFKRMTNVICPPSSRADAMGSFGSCGDAPTENGNMEFSLVNEDQTMGYIGNMIYNSTLKKLQVNYYAQFGEFILPYVEINMRVTSINHGTLSANTTFVSVINKIISIWKKMFNQRVPTATTTDLFWESLKASNIFSDLAVVGSNKSVGDFFQEITSVVKNGGYDRNINVANQYRIGAMGDGPSGTRAAFIISNANKDSIQNATLAGYFSPTNGVFVGYNNVIRGGKRTKKNTRNNCTLKKKYIISKKTCKRKY